MVCYGLSPCGLVAHGLQPASRDTRRRKEEDRSKGYVSQSPAAKLCDEWCNCALFRGATPPMRSVACWKLSVELQEEGRGLRGWEKGGRALGPGVE